MFNKATFINQGVTCRNRIYRIFYISVSTKKWIYYFLEKRISSNYIMRPASVLLDVSTIKYLTIRKDMNPSEDNSGLFIPVDPDSPQPTDIGTVEVSTTPTIELHDVLEKEEKESRNKATKTKAETSLTLKERLHPYIISHPVKKGQSSSILVNFNERRHQNPNYSLIIDRKKTEAEMLLDTTLEIIGNKCIESEKGISFTRQNSDGGILRSFLLASPHEIKPSHIDELPEELNVIPKSSLLSLPDIPSTRMAPHVNPTLDTHDSKGNLPRLDHLGVTQDSLSDNEDNVITEVLKVSDLNYEGLDSNDGSLVSLNPDVDCGLDGNVDDNYCLKDVDVFLDVDEDKNKILLPSCSSVSLLPSKKFFEKRVTSEKKTTHTKKNVEETITSDNMPDLETHGKNISDSKTDSVGSDQVFKDAEKKTKLNLISRGEHSMPGSNVEADKLCSSYSIKRHFSKGTLFHGDSSRPCVQEHMSMFYTPTSSKTHLSEPDYLLHGDTLRPGLNGGMGVFHRPTSSRSHFSEHVSALHGEPLRPGEHEHMCVFCRPTGTKTHSSERDSSLQGETLRQGVHKHTCVYCRPTRPKSLLSERDRLHGDTLRSELYGDMCVFRPTGTKEHSSENDSLLHGDTLRPGVYKKMRLFHRPTSPKSNFYERDSVSHGDLLRMHEHLCVYCKPTSMKSHFLESDNLLHDDIAKPDHGANWFSRPTSTKTRVSDVDSLVQGESFSSLIKQELKLKIQLERLGRGQDELKLEPERPKQYELTEEEKAKKEKRMQQNRESALRSRERFYRHREKLKQLVTAERKRQSDLKSTLANLQKKKAKSLDYLIEHEKVCSCSQKKEELKEKLAQLARPRTISY